MLNSQIIIGSLIIIGGCGALYLVVDHSHSNRSIGFSSIEISTGNLSPEVHSAAWYVRHPDVLKQDERHCAGNAGMMTPAACQNVASADAQLAGADYAKAAAAFNAPAGQPNTNLKPP
ncbi:MAG: hypothetical protein ACYCZB_03880 [Acidiphilium sp.]